MNIFWTRAAIAMTGISLILTGCSHKEAAKAEAGEMGEPMATPPKQAVDSSNAISSLEERLKTEKLGEKEERDLRKLISDMKENADLRARYERRQ